MHRVAGSFVWPLRAPLRRWIAGTICVLLLPVLFIPLLGYSIAATRSDSPAPPPWTISWRLLTDGFWTAVVLLLTALPFAIALPPLARALHGGLIGTVIALFALLFAWGLLALLFLPHATAAFAATGKPADLFNFVASVRHVRANFGTWNVAVGAIVTGWGIGLACAALLCVGVVPGIFYAILVSAHAAGALEEPRLHGEGPHPSPG